MTREEAWQQYFEEHPDVLASWRHQNGHWPMGYDLYLDGFDPEDDEQ